MTVFTSAMAAPHREPPHSITEAAMKRTTLRQLVFTLLCVSMFLVQFSMLHSMDLYGSSSTTVDSLRRDLDAIWMPSSSSSVRILDNRSSSDSDFALLTDGIEQWQVRKRSLDELQEELWETVQNTYLERGPDQLSVYTTYGIGSVLEMEDPQGGRDARCFKRYYKLWENEEPFSGEPFFDWLDFGSARRNWDDTVIHKPDCTFNEFRGYRTFTDEERERSVAKVVSHSGVVSLVWKHGEPVQQGEWLFIWGLDKRMYLVKDGKEPLTDGNQGHWKWGHCTPLGGRPILHAGAMEIAEGGRIVWADPISGHYKPSFKHIRNFYRWMRDEMGANVASLKWKRIPHLDYKAPEVKAQWQAVFR